MTDENRLPSELAKAGADALLPGLGALGGRLGGLVRQEWERNTSRALAAAEEASGLSREDLEQLLGSHPETVPLLVQVLYAAGMNGHDRTLRAMGAGLGLAAEAAQRSTGSRALADIEGALRGIRDFDDRHFAVLGHLIPLELTFNENGVPDYDPFSMNAIATAVGLEEASASSCCLALTGAGLLQRAPALTVPEPHHDVANVFLHGGSDAYLVTRLGRALWHAARLYA